MFAAGDIIDDYQLVSPLGEGPKAYVWAAKRVDRLEMVTLKMLRASVIHRTQLYKAFERLTQSITSHGRLEHRGLPRIVGTARRTDDGLFGLVSEHMPGQTLERYDPMAGVGGSLLDSPAAFASVLSVIEQLSEISGWLHANNVLHGNIKPSNVLVTSSSRGVSVRLLDLCWSRAGLAGFSDAQRAYISPELGARRQLSAASDQWSIAKILHQLIVKASPNKTQTQALTAAPITLLKVLQRALDKEPQARFDAMADFVQNIRAVRLEQEQKISPENAQKARAEQVGYNPTAQLQQMSEPTMEQPAAPRRQVPRAPSSSRPVPQAPSNALAESPPTDRGEVPALTAPVPAIQSAPAKPASSAAKSVPPEKPNRPAKPGQAPQSAPAQPLGAIDPSQEKDFSGRLRPVQPSDATDVVPAVSSGSGGPSLRLLAGVAVLLTVLVAIGGYTLFDTAQAPIAGQPAAGPPTAQAPVPPERNPVEPPKPQPPPTPPVAAKAPPVSPPKAPPPEAPPPPPTQCASGSACLTQAKATLRSGDKREAKQLFERGCKLRSMRSCIEAGSLLAKGTGAEKKRARRSYERACDARLASACAKLAELYQRGIGGGTNERTAAAFRRRACQLGRQQSCE